MAPDGLAVAAWAAIGADPSLAAVYRHVLALDPPPVSAGVRLLAAGPGEAVVYLGWGEPEREFTLAHWRGQLTIRPALVELWRALASAAARASGEALAALLRGAGSYPRDGALAARLVGVLGELGLARYEPQSRVLVTLETGATDLQRSPAARAYAARLAEAERHLTQPPARSRAVARAG
jgi:hypothetical protein